MNKGFRFILSLILVAALVCGTFGCYAEGALEWTAGSIVTFGRYPQTEAGTDETPIEWIVLEVDEANHRALLLSKYGLDAKAYHTELEKVTWEDCSLRSWLNNDFLNRAFNADERSAILLTDVDNSDEQGYSEWNTSGGNNTQDKIFLLSYAEAKRYFNIEHHSVSGSGRNKASRVSPTAYAIRQGAWRSISSRTADDSVAGIWWLRSPGRGGNGGAAYVQSDGSLRSSGVISDDFCVRPAMWISLESEPSRTATGFVFRNGITWGMSSEEVIEREGNEYNESRSNGCQRLSYDPAQVSKYSGMLDYLFFGNALQFCAYCVSDADQETFNYLLTAYDTKYGERREADLQELVDFQQKITLNIALPMYQQEIRGWLTEDGTRIWMVWGDFTGYSLVVCYVSPALLNPPEEGPDMTGI